jgi:hypothetical protein
MKLLNALPQRNLALAALVLSMLLLSALVISALFARRRDEGKIVIVVALSGVSNRDKIYLPHIFGKGGLASEGALYRDIKSLDFEFHMPTLTAVLTGKRYDKFSAAAGVKGPTLFQLLRKKNSLPADKTWMIGAWHTRFTYYEKDGWGEDTAPCNICPLVQEFSRNFENCRKSLEPHLEDGERELVAALPDLMEKDRVYPQWDAIEDFQYGMLWKILKFVRPALVCYVFSAPEVAHFGAWSRYVAALRESDERIYNLWNYLKTDPYYRGRTILAIYVDHERNAYYMHHNENLSDNPSVVWALVLKNFRDLGWPRDKAPLTHQDVFTMVSKWLDLP